MAAARQPRPADVASTPLPGKRARPGADDNSLILQPAVIVPMSEEQFQRAASVLAELLLWAWEQERDERRGCMRLDWPPAATKRPAPRESRPLGGLRRQPADRYLRGFWLVSTMAPSATSRSQQLATAPEEWPSALPST